MDEETISKYAYLLYTNLVQASPKRTRNMARNITIKEYNDRYIITISNGVPYARYVNYNWGNRDDRSKREYIRKGLHKERENYKWVEKTMENTLISLHGRGVVSNEIY